MTAPGLRQFRAPAEVRAIVQYMVRNFDRDPVRSREILRDFAISEPRSFVEGAVPFLKNAEESRGTHYLLTLIVAHDLLLPALSHSKISQADAMAMARAAIRVDALADVTLAKQLADRASDETSPLPAHQAGRVMEVLAGISDGARLLPSLMRMLRHPNPYLRSKAVKLIGRGIRSTKWVQSRLAEADARIRANAIEAIWGLDTEESRALLQLAAKDCNNRVAGNALVALYRIGDCSSIPELLKMSTHDAALFRATAAWAMGETGDPRFTEALARLLRDSCASVRARTLGALGRVKAVVAESRQNPAWSLTSLLLDHEPQRGPRRIQVTVSGGENMDGSKLLPTNFILFEDGRLVTDYQLTERPALDAMSIVFLFPRAGEGGTPWMDAILQAREWKRPSDLWAVMPYLASAETRERAVIDEAPQFTANPQNIEAQLRQPSPRTIFTDVWSSLGRAVKTDAGPSRGRRCVILFSYGNTPAAAAYELNAAVVSSHAFIQVISRAPDPHMEEFCRRTHSSFSVVEDAATAERLSAAYLNLLARYEISWPALVPSAKELKLRIHAPNGWGEIALPLV